MRVLWGRALRALMAAAFCVLLLGQLAPAASAASAAGDVLSVAVSGAPTGSVRLNGWDQAITYSTMVLTVTNLGAPSVTGAGWNLTMAVTQFATATTPAHTLPTSALAITGASAACDPHDPHCTLPVNGVAYPLVVVAGAPVKVYNAAPGSGVGLSDIDPTMQLKIPANTYKGTYTSTITLAVISGP